MWRPMLKILPHHIMIHHMVRGGRSPPLIMWCGNIFSIGLRIFSCLWPPLVLLAIGLSLFHCFTSGRADGRMGGRAEGRTGGMGCSFPPSSASILGPPKTLMERIKAARSASRVFRYMHVYFYDRTKLCVYINVSFIYSYT